MRPFNLAVFDDVVSGRWSDGPLPFGEATRSCTPPGDNRISCEWTVEWNLFRLSNSICNHIWINIAIKVIMMKHTPWIDAFVVFSVFFFSDLFLMTSSIGITRTVPILWKVVNIPSVVHQCNPLHSSNNRMKQHNKWNSLYRLSLHNVCIDDSNGRSPSGGVSHLPQPLRFTGTLHCVKRSSTLGTTLGRFHSRQIIPFIFNTNSVECSWGSRWDVHSDWERFIRYPFIVFCGFIWGSPTGGSMQPTDEISWLLFAQRRTWQKNLIKSNGFLGNTLSKFWLFPVLQRWPSISLG